MTIDEAIKQFKYDAECNRADLDLSYAEDNEQIAKWLEELKFIRQWKSDVMDEFCKYDCNSVEEAWHYGYNKAIDDFIHECDKCCGFYTGNNKNLTREDMLNIAEQLKAVDMDEEDFENVCCDGKCRICKKCEEVSDER